MKRSISNSGASGSDVTHSCALPAPADVPWGPAGAYAIDMMRLEKGYRAFGHELGSETTPVEAGLSFTVAVKPKGFLGDSAVMAQQASAQRSA